jgi:hypothetical protein
VSEECECEITGMYELPDAIEAVISASDPKGARCLRRRLMPTARTFQTTSFEQLAHNRQRCLIIFFRKSTRRSFALSIEAEDVIRPVDRTNQ